jgi:hypothetical protein
MKKFMLLTAIAALSAMSSFGAACASGVTLQTLINNGACEVNNGQGALWTISNWGLDTATATSFGGVNPTASDLFVTWAPTAAGQYGGAGFSVTYTDAEGGINWFAVAAGNPNQKVNLKPSFWVTSSNLQSTAWTETNTALVSVTNTVLPNLPSQGGPGQVSVQKIINTQNGTPITDAHVFVLGGQLQLGTTDPAVRTGLNLNDFSVVDDMILTAGDSGGAALTSFTNSFYTASAGVPEPMTFVLMGAGLVGVAILRRRR